MTARTPTLHRLSDTTIVLANVQDDIRGYRVFDPNGIELGAVDDLVIDDVERKIQFLQVATGGFLGLGKTKFLIPIQSVSSIDGNRVNLRSTQEQVAGAPAYDPELKDLPDAENIYKYYWP